MWNTLRLERGSGPGGGGGTQRGEEESKGKGKGAGPFFTSLLKVKSVLRKKKKGSALRKDLGLRQRASSKTSGHNLCPKN